MWVWQLHTIRVAQAKPVQPQQPGQVGEHIFNGELSVVRHRFANAAELRLPAQVREPTAHFTRPLYIYISMSLCGRTAAHTQRKRTNFGRCIRLSRK